MLTYQDFEKKSETDETKASFIYDAISQHQNSTEYQKAADAELYASGKNATISKYQKLLYTLKGNAVPDNFTANHKCKSGFFKRFVTQEVAMQLGNGVTFQKEETKNKLGKNFDSALYRGGKSALVQGKTFGFYNLDHVDFFKFTEFVPFWDEFTGELRAGIRYWQIDETKPLMATLFELDGYTLYAKENGKEPFVKEPKRDYKQIVKQSVADGRTIQPNGNYPGFPIVPLYGNMEHQSELEGKREQIDCHDLIKSGFANDLDDASMIYWTLSNCGGMDDVDLAQFVERMKTIKAAIVGGKDDDDGTPKAEAHTMDVPFAAREAYLSRLEKDLYKDFMALDTEQIAAGAVTATQIEAAYEPLNEKCDEFEMCLFEFLNGIFKIAGIDDVPTFNRSRISNESETTQMVLSMAEYLDYQTILELVPFIPADKVDEIMKRKAAEEVDRYDPKQEEEKEPDNPDEEEV